MEAIPSADKTRMTPQQEPGVDLHLQSLAGKVLSGDWVSDCASQLAESRANEQGFQRRSLKNQQELLDKARELQQMFATQQRRQAKESGSHGFWAKLVSSVAGAISAALILFCPAVAGVVGILGAVVSGSLSVMSAYSADGATSAETNAMRSQLLGREASEARDEILAALERSIVIEKQMGERLLKLSESQDGISRAALDGMRR